MRREYVAPSSHKEHEETLASIVRRPTPLSLVQPSACQERNPDTDQKQHGSDILHKVGQPLIHRERRIEHDNGNKQEGTNNREHDAKK